MTIPPAGIGAALGSAQPLGPPLPAKAVAKKSKLPSLPSGLELLEMRIGRFVTGAINGKGPVWQQALFGAASVGFMGGLGAIAGKLFHFNRFLGAGIGALSGAGLVGIGRITLPSMGPKVKPATKDKVEQLFTDMKKSFNPEAAKDVYAKYQFDLTGKFGGKWVVAVEDGKYTLDKGTLKGGHATATFHASADDWLAVTNGELDAQKAFLSGRLRIDGDLQKALQLEAIFPD